MNKSLSERLAEARAAREAQKRADDPHIKGPVCDCGCGLTMESIGRVLSTV